MPAFAARGAKADTVSDPIFSARSQGVRCRFHGSKTPRGKSMKKLLLSAAAALALAGTSSAAGGPFSAVPGQQAHQGPIAKLFGKKPLPAFQAAPWYLYWPYNSHFMTPAPLTGAYYAPPTAGQVNPYFPGGR
jgi:hypothetical protein